jgi:hypothetical protein
VKIVPLPDIAGELLNVDVRPRRVIDEMPTLPADVLALPQFTVGLPNHRNTECHFIAPLLTLVAFADSRASAEPHPGTIDSCRPAASSSLPRDSSRSIVEFEESPVHLHMFPPTGSASTGARSTR